MIFQLPNKLTDRTEQRKMFVLLGKLVLLLQNKSALLAKFLTSGSDDEDLTHSFGHQSLLLFQMSQFPLQELTSGAKSTSSTTVVPSAPVSGHLKQSPSLLPSDCHLTCMGSTVPYGFEFQSLDARVFLHPQSERALIHLVSCLREEKVALTASPHSALADRGVVEELAQVRTHVCIPVLVRTCVCNYTSIYVYP